MVEIEIDLENELRDFRLEKGINFLLTILQFLKNNKHPVSTRKITINVLGLQYKEAFMFMKEILLFLKELRLVDYIKTKDNRCYYWFLKVKVDDLKVIRKILKEICLKNLKLYDFIIFIGELVEGGFIYYYYRKIKPLNIEIKE